MRNLSDVFEVRPADKPIKISTKGLVKAWNHLWWIYERQGRFGIVKYQRLWRVKKDFMLSVSPQDAQGLIETLGLSRQYVDPKDSSVVAWRRPEHLVIYYRNWAWMEDIYSVRDYYMKTHQSLEVVK